jgi:rubrerythrin
MSWIRSLFSHLPKFVIPLFSVFVLTGAANAASTVDNLKAAFNGESNAHLRYLAFAQRADTEGYGEIASLFRAVARAEQIHAANHAEVIKEMGGGVPQAQGETLTIRSTRENLDTAIKGETYERDTMYPDFLKQARADANVRATRTLNYAKTAEAEHAKLFSEAFSKMSQLKGSSGTTYYVCPTCGFTSRDTGFSKCPSCFTRSEGFETVS